MQSITVASGETLTDSAVPEKHPMGSVAASDPV